ncbi:Chaperone protein HtpG [Buchnera aphidicola (Phyllaphis fagi)]|uniref:molecular chaperone HtpG n=1 Tax=Buchnera aphidicola TaxID=9 RepID=UPI003463E96D
MKKNEKYSFQSETKQLLHLMIHSLYSNKEIFIRELISNASDAIDKMRFKFLSNEHSDQKYRDMYIRILLDKKENKIVISDNGIGMTKQEIINNLGTIANSGTKSFLKSLNKENKKNNQLIGKFGVGFYSSFIVSDKVIVRTRHAEELNQNNGTLWKSDGKGEYTITSITKKEYGTDVELYLKKEEIDFLEDWKICNIVKKYSDHITIPIEIQEYDKKNKVFSWKQINTAQALWTLEKSKITDDQYKNFYKHITQDMNDPIIWSHNKVEGTQEYISLLYIPSKSHWDIWNRDQKKNGLKLYIKRIYIMDNAEQFLPSYLRFIKGILDTNDLPLNVSREMLQENNITHSLKTSITKRVLMLIKQLTKNNSQYQIFWKEFGLILKEGIAEDTKNQEKIAELLRFTSIKTNCIEQNLSLSEYIQNMPNNQEKIYFLTADSYATVSTSPHLEIFKKNNIDVLLLCDRIDEWMMNYLTDFKGKKFQSVNKIDDDLNKIVHEKSKSNNSLKKINTLLLKIQEVLKEKIKKVQLSYRLIDTPAILLIEKDAMSTQMSKLFMAAGQNIPPVQYIFEINPNHKLIKKISNLQDDKNINIWIQILFEEALLSERGSLDNPNDFINKINQIFINS